MAPLPEIADVFRCAVKSNISGGQYAINVIHIRSSTLSGPDVGDALAVRVADGNSPWTNLMATIAEVVEVSVTPLDGSSAATQHPVTSGAGLVTGDPMIASGAIVSLRTGLRGPANRGRIYVPFLGEGGQNSGYLTSGVQDQAQDGMTAWITDLAAESMQLGVASYVHAQFHLAVTTVVEQALATQRRRQKRARGAF